MISFFVPGEPRGKGRPRFVQGRKPYTDARTEQAERAVAWECRKAMAGRPPLEGPLELRVYALYAQPASWSKQKKEALYWKTSKPDLDNIVKLVKDALNKVAWLDDAQVVSLAAWKHYSTELGVEVQIREL